MKARDTLRAALIQSEIRWQEPEINRKHLEKQIREAPTADLFVLPETFTTGFLGDAGSKPEGMDGASVQWMQRLSRELGSAITGSLVIDEGGSRFNRMVFVTPEGGVQIYDKAHLFGYGGEDQRYTPGKRRVSFSWRGWNINLQICYDLRFPVWCRNRGDCELMIFVANWPAPRADAWTTLLKARAIENQAFVIGVNRCGRDGNGIQYPGLSGAWSANGDMLGLADETEQTLMINLDRQDLVRTREKYPFLEDADRFSVGRDTC